MSLSIEQAPAQRSNAAARTAYNQSTNATGGSPPSEKFGAFEAKLAGDDLTKAKLHRLVLILPLAVLIFGQALRSQGEIDLPIIKLKVPIKDVLPIFLLILSYMLHRAMRYARIVLWNVLYAPRQVLEIARISLDDTEAYKMNSALYEEVLDPMSALIMNWRWGWARFITRASLVTFNVAVALIAYIAIFLMLAAMTYYASLSAIDVAVKLQVMQFRPSWPMDATRTIDVLVLSLACFLLGMAWLNAAWIVLTPAMLIMAMAIGSAFVSVIFIWRAVRFGSPRKFLARAVLDMLTSLREKHRDRALARDLEEYNATNNVSPEQRQAEFEIRCGLYYRAQALQRQVSELLRSYGLKIFADSKEWQEISGECNFGSLDECVLYIKILAHRAPINFVKWRAPALINRTNYFINRYTMPADEALQSLIAREDSLTPEERERTAAMIRLQIVKVKRLSTQIGRLHKKWQRTVQRFAIKDDRSEPLGRVQVFIHRDSADLYFQSSGYSWSDGLLFNEPAPKRGAHDWPITTRFMDWLDRVSWGTPA